MLKQIYCTIPAVMKQEWTEVKEKVGEIGGFFGARPIYKTKTVVSQVPDYPATNEKIAEIIYNTIMRNKEEIGEIRSIKVESSPDNYSYLVRIVGSKLYVEESIEVPEGFGKDVDKGEI